MENWVELKKYKNLDLKNKTKFKVEDTVNRIF